MKKILIIAISIFLTSCYTTRNRVYLNDKDFTKNVPTLIPNEDFKYLVQPNDVLSVIVKSLDVASAELFNVQPQNQFGQLTGESMYQIGFLVSQVGEIKLPIVGKVEVAGLTVSDIQELLQEKIDEYLVNSTVIVKLASFKIAFLGEVNRPGYYFVYNNQANIFEGLGLAGDTKISANIKNVKLIRQKAEGTEVIVLDLTDPDIIESEYYYLLPNDIVYIEPYRADTGRSNLTLLSILFSAVSTAALLINVINNN